MKRLSAILDPKSFLAQTNWWLILKTVIITILTIALFFKDLTLVFSDSLQSDITSYLVLIPFLLIYMIYRKRKMLTATMSIEPKSQSNKIRILQTLIGILAFATAILLYWYGSYTFTPVEYHMISLPIFTAGLILILFNVQTLRQLAFPIAFLFFLVPPPSDALYLIGGTLSTLSSQASNTIIQAIGIPSTLITEYNSPIISIIRANGAAIQFSVDIACSGVYSLIGFSIFAVLIAYLIRDKPWKKLALILIGFPVIFLFNIVRITILLLIGYQFGENMALELFHSIGGLILIFGGTLLLLFFADRILRAKLFQRQSEPCPQCQKTQPSKQDFCPTCGKLTKLRHVKINKIDLIKISALTLSVIILISIQAPVFAITKSPVEVMVNTPTGQQTSLEIFPAIPNHDLQFITRDTSFEEIAKIDMALSFAYFTQNTSDKNIWISLEISSVLSNLHKWETCLVDYPLQQGLTPKVTKIALEDVQMGQNPPIIARYFAFKDLDQNQTQAVLYWYQSAAFSENSTLQRKNVKISVIAFPDNDEELPQIKLKLESVAKSIISYWEPIETWSPVSLVISQNGAQLAETTAIMLFISILLIVFEERRQKQINRKAYQKLSKTDKQIVDAIFQTQKQNTSTTENIAASFNKTAEKEIDKKLLFQKLTELENVGIVKRNIANRRDEPIQTWKA